MISQEYSHQVSRARAPNWTPIRPSPTHVSMSVLFSASVTSWLFFCNGTIDIKHRVRHTPDWILCQDLDWRETTPPFPPPLTPPLQSPRSPLQLFMDRLIENSRDGIAILNQWLWNDPPKIPLIHLPPLWWFSMRRMRILHQENSILHT